MAKILVVEDDIALGDGLYRWLKRDGHVVTLCQEGNEALKILSQDAFDLIVLDWGLPGLMQGIDVANNFRQQGGNTPIIFLTGRSDTQSVVAALEGGADGYMIKPFPPEELSARIVALLRRPANLLQDISIYGNLRIDRKERKVFVEDQKIALTAREFDILEFLTRHPNQSFTAKQLLTSIWSSFSETSEESVRTLVKTLRHKLAENNLAEVIETLRGGGYVFRSNSD